MEYVKIAMIMNTFGIRGELKVKAYTDFVSDRFKKGSIIYIGEDKELFEVLSYREHKGHILLSLKGYEDINLVEKYKGKDIYKNTADIKPLKDGYYFRDLKDLGVYVNDEYVGKVLRVEEGVRNNNLRIFRESDQKEYLVPFLDVFVKKVDLKEKRIDIIEMAGLL